MGTKATILFAGAVAVGASFAGGMYARDFGVRAPEPAPPWEVAELRRRVRALEEARPVAPDDTAEAVTSHVAAHGSRIEALESAVAELCGAGLRPASAGGRDPEAEARRLAAMTDDEVFGWLTVLVSTDMRGVPVDGTAVVEASDVLLSRSLDPAKRSEALCYKGIGLRARRDLDAAAAAFREAAALVAPRTREARMATLQLAWTASKRGDPRGAAEAFLVVADDEGATQQQQAWTRVHAAAHFQAAGDPARAVAEYKAVLERFGASEDMEARKAADHAREALAATARPPGR
jgi:hypothetical protein